MSSRDEDVVRAVAREVLAEVLPALLDEALASGAARPNGNGYAQFALATEEPGVPQVPAPPVAAVHRPVGWSATRQHEAAVAPGERGIAVESVAIDDDASLAAFVHALARRLGDESQRAAVLDGRVRFRLASGSSGARTAGGSMRIESGAVTERIVKEAARAGTRLVLAPRAVLTPMARDCARSLGVEIEKERAC